MYIYTEYKYINVFVLQKDFNLFIEPTSFKSVTSQHKSSYESHVIQWKKCTESNFYIIHTSCSVYLYISECRDFNFHINCLYTIQMLFFICTQTKLIVTDVLTRQKCMNNMQTIKCSFAFIRGPHQQQRNSGPIPSDQTEMAEFQALE